MDDSEIRDALLETKGSFDKALDGVMLMRSSLLEERKMEHEVFTLAINNSIEQDKRHREDMKDISKNLLETNRSISTMAVEFHSALGEVKSMTKCVGTAVDEIKSDKKEIFKRLNTVDSNVATINALIGANEELQTVKIDSVKTIEELRDKKQTESTNKIIALVSVVVAIITLLYSFK